MNKFIGYLIVCAIFVGGFLMYKTTNPKVGGIYFIYPPTMATSSVGSLNQTLVLSSDSARTFASFCNSTTTATSYISLQIGATSTSPSGIQIAGGSCYEMSPEKGNLFTTSVYAQTTAGSSTLTTVTQSKSN